MISVRLKNPTLILTAGEPAGIGPDLCVKIAQKILPCNLVVIADKNLLQDRARAMRLPLKLLDYSVTTVDNHRPGRLIVLHVPLDRPSVPGKLDLANSRYVLKILERAIEGCCSGEFDGIVTAPVHKGIINDAGIAFTGHTEYLSRFTNTKVVMMLIGGNMRVTLATTHLPIKDVAKAITPLKLEQKLRIINLSLRTHFLLPSPRIVVAGLNPHSGESGYLGREEVEVIIPVLKKLRAEGINVIGPLPADTLFNPVELANYDCVFAMYHDQGLPVFKYANFGMGVNVTLGLPIIRTSVDHGTALNLAATGQAKSGSLLAAIEMAITLIKNRSLNG